MQFGCVGSESRHGRDPGGLGRAGGAQFVLSWAPVARGSVTSPFSGHGFLLAGDLRLAYAADIETDHWSATCRAALRSSMRIDSARVAVSRSPARSATRLRSS